MGRLATQAIPCLRCQNPDQRKDNAMLTFSSLNIGLVVAVASTLGTLGATSTPGDETANDPLSCGIEVNETGGNARLEGWVLADKDSHGTYEMKIRKSGRGGSSTINQSGDFSVKAGETQALGTVLINGAKNQIDAKLLLHVNGKKFVCTSAAPVTDL